MVSVALYISTSAYTWHYISFQQFRHLHQSYTGPCNPLIKQRNICFTWCLFFCASGDLRHTFQGWKRFFKGEEGKRAKKFKGKSRKTQNENPEASTGGNRPPSQETRHACAQRPCLSAAWRALPRPAPESAGLCGHWQSCPRAKPSERGHWVNPQIERVSPINPKAEHFY